MSILNLEKEMIKVDERINVPEERLGKELLMPFAPDTSGARKILFSMHTDQRMQLIHSEVPLISTGFENQLGEVSSSYKVADHDAEIIAKIPKYSMNPNLHYYVIVIKDNGELDVIDRIAYNHITESYGYLLDNTYLDSKKIGDTIEKNDVIQKSRSFDKYNNRMDGVNLRTTYLACSDNTEDSILISQSAANKLVSPLIKKVSIVVNDNDILLNLYGDSEHYKVIPDIGEMVQHGILTAVRRENKDESLFSQSYENLRNIMLSDEKFVVKGRVIDIDVYCNNIDNINDSVYNEQLKVYWDDRIRMCKNIIGVITSAKSNGYSKMSYNLQKLYDECIKTIDGKKFSKTKPFSNIGIDITIFEELPLVQGDKITNRYGGKGVAGHIIPDEQMPRLANGDIIELIYNQATGTNRLNLSQFFEYEINYFGSQLLEYLATGANDQGMFTVADTVKEILDFIRILNPKQADYYENIISMMDDEELITFLNNITGSGGKGIMLSMMPITNNASIKTIEALMDRFPYVKQSKIYVYFKGSDGSPRYVESQRPVIVGYEYIYRLKQYAEEKFSTTSLSSTNLRGENSRSKAASQFKEAYTKTPVRFGEMETMISAHLGMDAAVFMLMLNSTSPAARRRAEELLTNPTIDVDVKLGEHDSSRIAETFNAYFKTLGLKLVFSKVSKKRHEKKLFRFGKPKPLFTFGKKVEPLFTFKKPGQQLFVFGKKRDDNNGQPD